MSVLDLVRQDLRDFAGYASARKAVASGDVWLNANESAWENAAPASAGLRRYPDPQPEALRRRMAGLYGVDPAALLVTRGSDEAIDLLVRATCRPGADAIVVTPPTFGMYAVSARLHGVPVVEAPLSLDGDRFGCDFAGVARAARDSGARLVFLCSPGNPTGSALPLDGIRALVDALRGQAVVVVDEAYQEFSEVESAVSLLPACDTLAVLRTLSKAHALAAARIGAVMASPVLVSLLQRCQAPYPLARPATEAALAALADEALAVTGARIGTVRAERLALEQALRALPGVAQVHPSDANFLLVRFVDAERAWQSLLAAGVVVRDMRAVPGLADALRITIGTPVENARVATALATVARVVNG